MSFSWAPTTTRRLGSVRRRSPACWNWPEYNIQNAIIDKNVRIGDHVTISPEGKDHEMTGEGYYIRDGIVVIPKNSVIPSYSRI